MRKKKKIMLGLGCTLYLLCWVANLCAQEIKWAQTGFNFLIVTPDARSGGMGQAMTAISANREALFHNPATMADISSVASISVNSNSWIADIKHLSLNVLVRPFSGNYGVMGLSLQSVDYGEFLGTLRYDNPQGYVDTEIMNPSALALGVGYAKMITDWFSVGGQIKFCYQSLGKSIVPQGDTYITKRNIAKGIAVDFGTHFKTGIKSIAFGMSVRNYSKEIKYEVESFQLPLLFMFGISANVFDFFKVSDQHKLTLAIDATHPRSHPEQLRFGAEYNVFKALSLRLGYVTNNSEDDITYGIGVSTEGLGLKIGQISTDYSYTPFGVFGNVQRFTIRFDI